MVNLNLWRCDGSKPLRPLRLGRPEGQNRNFEQEAAELTENNTSATSVASVACFTRMLIFNRLAHSESVPNPCDPRDPWFHSVGWAENKLNLIEYIYLHSHLIVVVLCR